MSRPSLREKRRQQICLAFATVLAEHGYGGATMVAVAEAAGVSPGLLHHHFIDKLDILRTLIAMLKGRFRTRLAERADSGSRVDAYLDAALRLDHRADVATAKCWVGIFAEAMRDPVVFHEVQKFFDEQTRAISAASDGRLDLAASRAVVAFVSGALVVGAFAPKKTAGFAFPAAQKMVRALEGD